MEKLDMETSKIVNNNLLKIRELFPNCVSEDGIDFEKLKQELSNEIIDSKKEKYELTWPGKKEALLNANRTSNNTARPVLSKSVEFEKTKNIYIEGDNLEALKILQESYLNKIKCIYIDPPYNTGKNLIYKNDYSIDLQESLEKQGLIDENGIKLSTNTETNGRFHSDWLSMMYSRIKLARNLLRNDGVIVLAIDDSELINLTKICDEIFGENNRIGIVTVVHKPEGRNQAKYFATSNEYALFYCKDQNEFEFESVILDQEMLKDYDLSDEKGSYKLISAIAKNHGREGYDKNLRINNPKNYYPIYVSSDLKEISLDKEYKDGYVAYPVTSTQERTWRYIKESMNQKIQEGEFVAQLENGQVKIYEKYRVDKGQLIKTHWVDKKYNANTSGTKILDELMGVKTFDFPKSLYLMYDILKLCTKNDDIVLDFFSGSATTAHALMKLNADDGGNRQFILVQIPESVDETTSAYKNGYKTLCDIGEERIRRASKKIKEETNANIDYGFRVYKVDTSNMKDVYYKPSEISQINLLDYISNIKEERKPEDLLTQVILDLGLTLDLKIEERNILDNKVYYVEDNSLIACFDDQININIIDEICKCNPMRVVFKDVSFKADKDKINLEEKIKKLSPDTEVSVL
ncbi:MAG: site-specific DNA-methyltransferase [Bacilli bacterium]|nr:site-specific DNA-methyltransferase [Bacilli bacterium]